MSAFVIGDSSAESDISYAADSDSAFESASNSSIHESVPVKLLAPKYEVVVLIEKAPPFPPRRASRSEARSQEHFSSDDDAPSSQHALSEPTFHYERNYRWVAEMKQVEELIGRATAADYGDWDYYMNQISLLLFPIVEQDRDRRRESSKMLIAQGLNELEQKHVEDIFIYFHHNAQSSQGNDDNGAHRVGSGERVLLDEIAYPTRLAKEHAKFRPRYDFWIPITSCRANHNVDAPMYDFIPYFGDEKGISQDLAEFLEKNLRLNDPASAYDQSIHWVVGDLIKMSGYNWNVLHSLFKSISKSLRICTNLRGMFFVRLIRFCFPSFSFEHLYDISLDLKRAPQASLQFTACVGFAEHGEINGVEAKWPLHLALERSFRFHFCRKCYQLNCALHSDVVFPIRRPEVKNDAVESNHISSNLSKIQQLTIDKCVSLQWTTEEIVAYTKIDPELLANYLKCKFSTLENCPNTTQPTTARPAAKPHKWTKNILRYPIDIASERRVPHVPCYHPGRPCNEKCPCVASQLYCEKYCFCSDSCSNRFPGCNCSGSCRNTICICYASLRECDPDLCKKCSGCAGRNVRHLGRITERGAKRCQNAALQNGWWKRLFIAKSFVDGLGAFAGENIGESQLISEYVGERLTEEEAEHRGRIYDDYGCSYLFKLDRETTIDATVFGAPIRFANHSNTHNNCYAKIVMVNGEYRIGLYATRNIQRGEEILFDYGYTKDQKKFVNKTLPPPKSIVNSKRA